MTARAKLIILAILILTLTGGLLLATSYTQDLTQRLGASRRRSALWTSWFSTSSAHFATKS